MEHFSYRRLMHSPWNGGVLDRLRPMSIRHYLRFRYSLRGAIALVTILAALCGAIAAWRGTWIEYGQAVRSLRARGATIDVELVKHWWSGVLIPDEDCVQARRVYWGPEVQLTDADVEALSHLTDLQQLDVSGSALTDAHVARLASLTELKGIQCSGCEITDAAMRVFARCISCENLGIARTRVTLDGLLMMKDATSLEVIYAADCPMKCDDRFAAISRLPKLYIINLSGIANADVAARHLATSNASVVTLNGSDLTDEGLGSLATSDALSELYVSDTRISDRGCELFAQSTKVAAMSIAGCQISTRGSDFLTNNRLLACLNLERTLIDDEAIAAMHALPRLWSLSIAQTRVTDNGVKQCAGIRELAWLYVGGLAVSDATVQELAEALPGCSLLDTYQDYQE